MSVVTVLEYVAYCLCSLYHWPGFESQRGWVFFFEFFFSSVFCTMDVWGPLMPRGEKWEDTWLRIAISSAIRSSHWVVCWENNMTESLNFELEKTVCEHRKGTYRTYIYCGMSSVLLQGRPKFLSHFSSIVSSSLRTLGHWKCFHHISQPNFCSLPLFFSW